MDNVKIAAGTVPAAERPSALCWKRVILAR